jgi:hypothetical protein
MKGGIFLLEKEAVVDFFRRLWTLDILNVFHFSKEGPDCATVSL